MNPFKSLLIDINNKLDLPQPTKSRIILEIAADLNDTYQLYQKQGMSQEDALKSAKQKFNLDEQSLNDLVSIHQTTFRRWFDHLSASAQTWWERLILLCLLAFVLITGGITVMKVQLIEQASPFVWLIFALLIIAGMVFLKKIYQIHIKKDHHLSKVKRGLPLILSLSGATLVSCMWGYYWQLYSFKEYGHILETKMVYLLHTRDDSFPQVFHDLTNWMIASSSFVMIGMLAAILIGIMWYYLMMKVSKIEQAEAAVLLGD
jgi:hypothetical protein